MDNLYYLAMNEPWKLLNIDLTAYDLGIRSTLQKLISIEYMRQKIAESVIRLVLRHRLGLPLPDELIEIGFLPEEVGRYISKIIYKLNIDVITLLLEKAKIKLSEGISLPMFLFEIESSYSLYAELSCYEKLIDLEMCSGEEVTYRVLIPIEEVKIERENIVLSLAPRNGELTKILRKYLEKIKLLEKEMQEILNNEEVRKELEKCEVKFLE